MVRPRLRVLRFSLAWIALAAVAQCAEPRFTSLTVEDVVALLPPPPREGSAEGLAEAEAVCSAQHTRSEKDLERAKPESKLTPGAFQSVMGPEFTEARYPLLYDLLSKAAADSKYFTSQAKDHFARPRPINRDPRTQTTVEKESDYAYPSGHATRGMLWALLLSEIV